MSCRGQFQLSMTGWRWTAYALSIGKENMSNHLGHPFSDKGARPAMTCSTKLPDAVIMRKP